MKITNLSVQNFKSIRQIEDFMIFDDKIVCLIGRNGSGKSNLLKAFNALKDDHDLVDESLHESNERQESIEISAEIRFDHSDTEFLTSKGLKLEEISGFRVRVMKEKGKAVERTNFEPLNYKVDLNPEVEKNFKEMKSLLKNLDFPDEEKKKSINHVFVEDLPRLRDQPEQMIGKLEEVEDFVSGLEDQTIKENFGTLFNKVKELLAFNPLSKLNDLFDGLTIRLLDPETYTVLDEAPLDSLETDPQFSLLNDLIFLSGKELADFRKPWKELTNIQKDASDNLNKELKAVWNDHEIQINIEVYSGSVCFSFITPQGRKLCISNLSEGEQWFLRFYTALAKAKKLNQKIIWLFDEPGRSLHATAQANLKSYFEEISDSSQIIYTSHQPMMIQWHKLERIFLVENDNKTGTVIAEKLWKDEEVESPLREALSLFIGEELLTGKEHVVVEGISDYYLLNGWLRYFQNTRTGKNWSESYSIFNRMIVPAAGRDEIPLYLLFLSKKSKSKINSLGIPDSEDDAEIVKANLSKAGLDPLNKRVISLSKMVSENIKSIEDLFLPNEYLAEVKEYYKAKPELGFEIGQIGTPTKKDLTDGIVKYLKKVVFTNRDLDKLGIAQQIYRKLITSKKVPYDKKTEKKFERVFTQINKSLGNS